MRRFFAIRAILGGTLLTAVGCGDRNELAPPEIFYGADVCERCNMIISEERFATAMVLQTEEGYVPLVFDDVGCMFERAESATSVAAFYVHDGDDAQWIPAERAIFVLSEQIHSPMGSGVLAFASTERATAFAEESAGERLAWPQLQAKANEEGLLKPFETGAPRPGETNE